MDALFDNPYFLASLGIIGLILSYVMAGGHSNRRLTTADWAKRPALIVSTKKGIEQLLKPSPKRVCLWLGDYQIPQKEKPWPQRWQLFNLWLSSSVPRPFLIPSCNPLIEVVGKSGSGKTYSVIDPLILSAIDQGHPIVLYESKADSAGKGGQMSHIMAYAKTKGYKIDVFAPGRPYSCTINPLDFMKDYTDATMAKIIGDVLHANLAGKEQGKKDGFFGPAGARLVRACLQFAKSMEGQHQTADLAMAFAVLSLSDLPKRLLGAKEKGGFPFWSQLPFEQLMSVANAAPTSGGILGGAMDMLESLLEPNLIRSYVGVTNVELMLKPKTLLVLQTDTQRMSVVNPLLATILTLVINYNFSQERDCGLIVSIDELPTIILQALADWSNRLRSKGLVLFLGYQEYNQLEKNYGKEDVQILRGPANHRFLFNPGTHNTAKDISDSLGQTETLIRNRSQSYNFGVQGGGSRSTSEQVSQQPLLSVDQILNLPQGVCLYWGAEMRQLVTDPLSRQRRELTRPLAPQRMPLRKNYDDLLNKCNELWESQVFPWLVRRRAKTVWDALQAETEVRKRQTLADSYLPPPPEKDENFPF